MWRYYYYYYCHNNNNNDNGSGMKIEKPCEKKNYRLK